MRKTALALVGTVLLAAPAYATAQGQHHAQSGQQQLQPGTAGPHPSRQANGQGLFPPNQPVPEYSTGADSPDASLGAPGSGSPNAGSAGLHGSAGTSFGWKGKP